MLQFLVVLLCDCLGCVVLLLVAVCDALCLGGLWFLDFVISCFDCAVNSVVLHTFCAGMFVCYAVHRYFCSLFASF